MLLGLFRSVRGKAAGRRQPGVLAVALRGWQGELLVYGDIVQHDTGSHELGYSQRLHGQAAARVVETSEAHFQLAESMFDHHPRRENITEYDIMAYTWWRFLNDSDAPPYWLVQFPMVKATVRAMDTVTDFLMKKYQKKVTRFTLAGTSMSGWAAWLTAAVDSRVAGIIPIGMDLLNITENLHHQYRAYCGWSYMMKPFYELNITQELDSPRFSELASHVDPLAYNPRYANVSKYIIVATGDELFQPDNSRYYFSQLEGEKYLNIIPHVDSRFQGERTLINPMLVFHYRIIIRHSGFPDISWNVTTILQHQNEKEL
ncbi:autocrine proliferation repressor protein A-like [Eublepharis macularius]|uniref:Autocrine proliferation repressor protein A-like n=1 Tax=Eublepharis macularius TaxID=481883 RepID=A0AA97KSY2_EUBMA|nr:autocrine proliferation repressor protein A-like [Eublepharis macularius]